MGNMLPDYKELYSLMSQFYVVNSYTNEVFFYSGTEAIAFARNIKPLADLYKTILMKISENVTK